MEEKKRESNGKWVTIKGTHVFIKDGQSIQDALKEKEKTMSTTDHMLAMSKRGQPTAEAKAKDYGIDKLEFLDDKDLMKKYGLNQEIVNKHRKLDTLAKSNPSPVKHKEAFEYAKQKYDESVKKEREITPLLTSIVRANGGEMVGLNFRLKREDSLARKISSLMDEKGISVDKAKNNISDSVRYTSVINSENFTEHVLNVTRELEKNGFICTKRQNNFIDEDGKSKNGYKDMNCNFKDKSGFKFELQFNTPEGMKAKEGIEKRPNGIWAARHDGEKNSHFFYEQSRILDKNDPKNAERLKYFAYRTEMLFKNVKIPKNVEMITNIKKQE